MEAAIAQWMNDHNHHRIHQTLGYTAPWENNRPATQADGEMYDTQIAWRAAPHGRIFELMSAPFSPNGSGRPFQTLVAHFEANEFRFHADPESQSVQLFITGDAAVYNCRIQLTHHDELFQVRIHYPVVARDPKIRPLVAEALARANHGMSIGNFDIDMDTGDISFHLGQVIRGQSLDDEVIGGVFSAGLSTANRYFPAVMRVMFAGHTPADAVYLSELDAHADAVETTEAAPEPAPASPPPKPRARKPRALRKDPRANSTHELPGLFDGHSGDQDGRHRR